MYTKLHNYHWYVKGPNFFSLHVKFEELYTEVGQYLDMTAERVLAINGHPVATLKECLEQSIVKEAGKHLTAEEMVKDLSNDLQQLIEQLKEGQNTAEEAKDEMSADMILEMITQFEKHNWMLASYLGK
ncbi:Dps family protein [Macrococcus equipercicus]